MLKRSDWFCVPPKKKWCWIFVLIAAVCYAAWVILDLQGVELYYRTDPRGGAFLSVLGFVASSVSYTLHEKYLAVRVLGICVRRIYYVEFREGVFVPHAEVGKKFAHPGSVILLMRRPSPMFQPQSQTADQYALRHPFDSILIDVPKGDEDRFIAAFQTCMPAFSVSKAE